MLIDFTMENFKSFKNEAILSAEVGERLSRLKETNTLNIGDTSVLKSLLVFGPNGAGKSNLLDGLKTMKTMVLNDPLRITDTLPANQFLLNTTSEEKDAKFAVAFKKGEAKYRYEFSYQSKKITHEKLTTIKSGHESVYFERNGQSFIKVPESLSGVASRTKPNSLFLFMAQQNNDAVAIDVVTWFDDDLVFVGSYSEEEIPDDLAMLVKNDSVRKQLLRFLRFADFNIVDLEVLEGSSLPVSGYIIPPLHTNVRLLTVHKVYDSEGRYFGNKKMAMTSESRGTQKILMIALSIISAELSGDGKTLLFDEFDDSLHLELSQALIKIFNSKSNKNQFILTTHELQLLDAPIRVDQIYLVEKDFQGVSDLSSIFDFKDMRNSSRQGVSFMKRYIEGRFGAKPIIDPDEMLASLSSVQDEANDNG